MCIAKQQQRTRCFTLSLLFKRDPRCVKSQKNADFNSSVVHGTAFDCDYFQLGGLKNQMGYKKKEKKNGISAVKRHLM